MFSSDSEENADDSAILCDEFFLSLSENQVMGNFMLVCFFNKILYVGEIIGTPKTEELEVSFYRYNKRMKAFCKTLVHNGAIVPSSDLWTISSIKTKRFARFVGFHYNFQKYEFLKL